MGFFSGAKKAAGHMFDVRVDKWLGWDYIVSATEDYKNIVKDMATAETPQYIETFDDAMKRLGLTEADIQARKKEFTRLFIFFIAISVLIILYGLAMAFKGYMVTALVSFCISIYTLTQAFRFNFWLFQIKNRKLGCTIKEWMNGKTFDHLVPSEGTQVTKSDKDIKPGQ